MKGSWKVTEIAGIGVHIHWSFLILPAVIVLQSVGAGAGLAATSLWLLFVLALFGCVVLHELGHALMARRYGIGTRDITLLPIGGVARLERMPRRPSQELAVSLAGPAVNVAIAAVLFVGLQLAGGVGLFDVGSVGGSFWAQLMWANVALVIFNLLPAFPMDGGRVLRALLATRLPYDRATNIAAGTGQAMAVVFAIAGVVFGWWTLLFVAIFVFLAARGETQRVETQSNLRRFSVRDAMRRQFQTLPADARLGEVVRLLLFSPQPDFPVIDGSHLIGMLSTSDALRAASNGASHRPLAELTRRHAPIVADTDSLETTLDYFEEDGVDCLPVVHGGQLVGLLWAADVALCSQATRVTPDYRHCPASAT